MKCTTFNSLNPSAQFNLTQSIVVRKSAITHQFYAIRQINSPQMTAPPSDTTPYLDQRSIEGYNTQAILIDIGYNIHVKRII